MLNRKDFFTAAIGTVAALFTGKSLLGKKKDPQWMLDGQKWLKDSGILQEVIDNRYSAKAMIEHWERSTERELFSTRYFKDKTLIGRSKRYGVDIYKDKDGQYLYSFKHGMIRMSPLMVEGAEMQDNDIEFFMSESDRLAWDKHNTEGHRGQIDAIRNMVDKVFVDDPMPITIEDLHGV